MLGEFSPRCDGCHTVFKAEGDRAREPVSVGCFHTLCRACAEGDKGAYGALHHLIANQDQDEDENAHEDAGGNERQGQDRGGGKRDGKDYEVDARVKQLVRGRCVVCGGGDGGEAVVRDVVVEALRRLADPNVDNEDEGGEGGDRRHPGRMCGLCGGEGDQQQHPATHCCEDCNENMCENMARAHLRMRVSAGHSVKEIEGAKASAPALCPTHHQPLGVFFCKDDRCLVCIECMAGDHNGHGFVRAGSEMVEEMRAWLAADVARAEARSGELASVEVGFVEDREKVTASSVRAISAINAVFDELEKKRKELVAEVVKARKEVCQHLNDVRTTSQLLRHGIAAVQRALTDLATSLSLDAIQRVKKARQQLGELVETSKSVHTERHTALPTFAHNKELVNALLAQCHVLPSPPTLRFLDEAGQFVQLSEDGRRMTNASPSNRDVWVRGSVVVDSGVLEWTVAFHDSPGLVMALGVQVPGREIQSAWAGAERDRWIFHPARRVCGGGGRFPVRSDLASFLVGDTLGFRLDMTTRSLRLLKNGVDCGELFNGLPERLEPCFCLHESRSSLSLVSSVHTQAA